MKNMMKADLYKDVTSVLANISLKVLCNIGYLQRAKLFLSNFRENYLKLSNLEDDTFADTPFCHENETDLINADIISKSNNITVKLRLDTFDFISLRYFNRKYYVYYCLETTAESFQLTNFYASFRNGRFA